MTGDSAPLVRTVDLTRVYEVPGGRLYAVDNVSFDVWPGEAVAAGDGAGVGLGVDAGVAVSQAARRTSAATRARRVTGRV